MHNIDSQIVINYNQVQVFHKSYINNNYIQMLISV